MRVDLAVLVTVPAARQGDCWGEDVCAAAINSMGGEKTKLRARILILGSATETALSGSGLKSQEMTAGGVVGGIGQLVASGPDGFVQDDPPPDDQGFSPSNNCIFVRQIYNLWMEVSLDFIFYREGKAPAKPPVA